MPIYDVTVPIDAGMPSYPGDPGIEFEQWAALGRGDAANVTMLHLGAHTGTHVDAPAHFIEGAARISDAPLDALLGPARVLRIPDEAREITARQLETADLEGATRVIFKTRNSDFWNAMREGFRTDYTYLAPLAARLLVERGVRLVGIDYLSVERFGSESFETHTILLERGVVIVEGLDLRSVEAGDYELICLPLRLAGGTGDGAPARAVLRSLGTDK